MDPSGKPSAAATLSRSGVSAVRSLRFGRGFPSIHTSRARPPRLSGPAACADCLHEPWGVQIVSLGRKPTTTGRAGPSASRYRQVGCQLFRFVDDSTESLSL